VLSDVIGNLLPSAFAVALSPIPIVAVVLVLGSPRARTSGPAFALGWVGGLVAVSVIVVVVLGAGSDPDTDDPGVSWLKVGLGLLFLAMAAMQWKKRHHDGRPAPAGSQAPRRRPRRPLTPGDLPAPVAAWPDRV
jgi:hypothetical protein